MGTTAYALAGMLKPFNTCDTVLQYFKDQAPDYLIERARGVTTTDSGGAAERTTPGYLSRAVPDSSDTTGEPGVLRRRTRQPTSKRRELMSPTS